MQMRKEGSERRQAMNETAEPRPADARFFVRLGVTAILAIFGGAAVWSIAAPIDGAVIASGHVIVETNRKAVQHLNGGVVDSILVREGDEVTAGQVVARLDDTVQSANLALIDGQLRELYARRARLEAERDGAASVGEPYGVEEVLGSNLFATKLAGQAQLLEARRTTRVTQVALLNERIVQQNERIEGMKAQIDSLRDQRALIEDELEGVRELHEKGYAPKTRVRELERASRRLAGERGALRASVAEATMTPEATGSVKSVSADSFVDESTGISYYLVIVDIPQGEDLNSLLNDAPLVPGMPVEAFIRTGSRPAISYFLKPLTDALARSMREE